ncbi:MAG: exo-alpha-sialidase [Verrucomicrobiota bacterium]
MKNIELDPRNINSGLEIPTDSYSDQPFIVKTDDGAWLCCTTTGSGEEGASGQHVISTRSTDMGKTWSKPVPLEPSDGPEASYAVMLKVPGGQGSEVRDQGVGVRGQESEQSIQSSIINHQSLIPSGRIYAFYSHNTDNVREVRADIPGGCIHRVDSLGYFVFKYSDDHGKSWSNKRYPIPIREFECDRTNNEEGRVRMFWNVGKPFAHDDCGFVPHIKVGRMGHGFFAANEGVLLKSANILTETDPEKITWETLPDGEVGLKTPPGGGPISAEHSFNVLSDGSFYCVYRSIDGYPVCTYSRDGGHTWSTPEYKKYADGRRMKNPRAANFAWKCSNGKYLYWFHNHGGHFIREMLEETSRGNGLSEFNNCTPYDDRNPVWLCGGVEVDSPEGKVIQWSQPEIVLYDDDPYIRMSYPDMVEQDGRIFLTETQKDKARLHEIPPELVEGLWAQLGDAGASVAPKEGLLVDLPGNGDKVPAETKMPKLPSFIGRDNESPDYRTKDLRNGFTLLLQLRLDSLEGGQGILDSRTVYGQGLCLQTTEKGTIEIILNDGRTENRWDCDPGMLEAGKLHHVAVVVDGGPKVISFMIDGKFCDGGEFRQFGWGRFSRDLRDANGDGVLRIGSELNGTVESLGIYSRYLRTSEIIGNFKAERRENRNGIEREIQGDLQISQI